MIRLFFRSRSIPSGKLAVQCLPLAGWKVFTSNWNGCGSPLLPWLSIPPNRNTRLFGGKGSDFSFSSKESGRLVPSANSIWSYFVLGSSRGSFFFQKKLMTFRLHGIFCISKQIIHRSTEFIRCEAAGCCVSNHAYKILFSEYEGNLIDAARRDVQRPRQRVLRQVARFHKFFAENFARMNRQQFVRCSFHGFTFNFSAAASLRWFVSNVRNSRAPRCNAVATWRMSRLRCQPAIV